MVTLILLLAATVADPLTPFQRQACDTYLSIPNVDRSALNVCLGNAKRAEDQNAFLQDLGRLSGELAALQCPCSENGIAFDLDDIAMSSGCRAVFVRLRTQELSHQRGLSADPSAVEGATADFASCVQRRSQQRARQEALHQQEAAQAEEDRRFRLLVVDARDNGKTMQIVDSARLCDAKADRNETLSKIATEKKYAKKVGVVNLADLEELKNDLRDQDGQIAAVLSDLKRVHVAPLTCSDRKLNHLRLCAADQSDPPEQCANDESRVLTSLFRERLDP